MKNKHDCEICSNKEFKRSNEFLYFKYTHKNNVVFRNRKEWPLSYKHDNFLLKTIS